MSACIIKFTTNNNLQELSEALQSVVEQGALSIMLLTCSENDYPQTLLADILHNCPIPLCGGIFPKLIIDKQSHARGAIVLGLMDPVQIVNYTMLSSKGKNLQHYINERSKAIECYQNFIIIADALCSVVEDFTDIFYTYIGSDTSTIGGGAGSLDFQPQAVVYTNEGLIQDAIQVLAMPGKINNAITHGWEILDGPFLVTSAEGHYVNSLNYTPAYQLYRDAIKNKCKQTLEQTDFFQVSKNYPLGLISLDGELFVRDPIQSDGHHLQCVGNVAVHSMVYLLKGEIPNMVQATKQIAKQVARQGQMENLLLFDCISRDLFMGEQITSELAAFQAPFSKARLMGVMTLGEICNSRCGSIHLLNKSAVLGSF